MPTGVTGFDTIGGPMEAAVVMKSAALALLITALLSITSVSAIAQPAADAWQVTVAPYLLGAGVTGTTAIGPLTTEIDASFADILSHLEFGVMGMAAARKGDWGFGADVYYAGLGATGERPAADIDVDQTMMAFYGLRRLSAHADLTFGARVNGLAGRITLKEGANRTAKRDDWWLDPVAGLILRAPAKGKLRASLYTEVGGFGVGSTFAWQVFPTVGVALSDGVSLDLGYRWMGLDYESGDGAARFRMDTLTQGPIFGVAFKL
jgi:opacity protein-like surface antigen